MARIDSPFRALTVQGGRIPVKGLMMATLDEKLDRARVLVVGAGGLGSPVALYLAAAGVGTIGIVDDDVVDLSNLQRQIVHQTAEIGEPKVSSAARKLAALNHHVRVVPHRTRLGAENVLDLVRAYDLVVDGVDNFPTRYLLNDACVLSGVPLVEGGILRFRGMVMVVRPGVGPCYRCVFPEPPPAGAVPTCGQAGVLGAVAGIVGTLQAAEAVKLLAGQGKSLAGRILTVDSLAGEYRTVPWGRNPRCPVCGEAPTITRVREHALECAMRDAGPGAGRLSGSGPRTGPEVDRSRRREE